MLIYTSKTNSILNILYKCYGYIEDLHLGIKT